LAGVVAPFWTGIMTEAIVAVAPGLRLLALDGPDLGISEWLLRSPFHLGRGEENDLLLVDAAVSRRHACLSVADAAWELVDLGSRHGTYLNELRLPAHEAATVHAGDEVRIGPWRFRLGAATEAPAQDDAAASAITRLGNLAEQRLDLLLQAARELVEAEDEAALAAILTEYALLGSGYSRSALLRWDGEGAVHTVCLRPTEEAPAEAPLWSRSLLYSARHSGLSAIEAAEGEALNRTLMHLPLRRALCAAIVLDGGVDGFLYLDSDRPRREHHADAPSFCHALARFGSLALARLRRSEAERERLALETELQRARGVQQHLLPPAQGELAGWDYALHLEPGSSVGGDLADAFLLPDGRCAALLGDVSGTGVAAGLLMASVQAFLRAELAHEADPARAAQRLNTYLCAQSSGRFVTLWLGLFGADGRVVFVDAGHGLAWRADDAVRYLQAEGSIPLGVDAQARFVAEPLALAPHEALLLCSDGVTEQRSESGVEYGATRLAAALARVPQGSAHARLEALRADLALHRGAAPAADDTTVLLLRRTC
jgi:serine phosphatase RsbU (regulator of sigma subunit)